MPTATATERPMRSIAPLESSSGEIGVAASPLAEIRPGLPLAPWVSYSRSIFLSSAFQLMISVTGGSMDVTTLHRGDGEAPHRATPPMTGPLRSPETRCHHPPNTCQIPGYFQHLSPDEICDHRPNDRGQRHSRRGPSARGTPRG